jgi:hypothetical protein
MPLYLDTSDNQSVAIGICDRCHFKFPIGELKPDRNFPGLMVCDKDNDEYDPYRLAPPPADRIGLQFARPDAPLTGAEPSPPNNFPPSGS